MIMKTIGTASHSNSGSLPKAEGKTQKDDVAKIISSNSAQKSHVKPQNYLSPTRSTTSTWHVYPLRSGTIKLASKTTEDVLSHLKSTLYPQDY
jgi:hypothetical protein